MGRAAIRYPLAVALTGIVVLGVDGTNNSHLTILGAALSLPTLESPPGLSSNGSIFFRNRSRVSQTIKLGLQLLEVLA